MDTPSEIGQSPKEHRILAAIVFTDAVGFSKLAGRDEQAALAILKRDFKVMMDHCERQGGRVLKTMGDGMLMMFPSAVDAMQAALNIQDDLYGLSQKLPAVSVLQHRIGVHLGDIIIQGEDVFGDGVNVAARLQSEAKPGAICYSRTVSDVIKNKVQVNAKYLGPRQLKNIDEPVMVWQVPPVGEPFDAPTKGAAAFSDIHDVDEHVGGMKGLGMVIVSIGLLVCAGLILAFLIKAGPKREFAGRKHPLKKASTSSATGTTGTTPTPTNGTTATGNPTTTGTTGSDQTNPASTNLDQQVSDLKKDYEFQQIVDLIKGSPPDSKGVLAQMQSKYLRLAQLRGWLETEIAATSAQAPINVTIQGKPAKIYATASGMSIDADGQAVDVRFGSLPPATIEALTSSLLEKSATGKVPPPDARNWLQIFAAEYSG